jgi:hypothetical protein
LEFKAGDTIDVVSLAPGDGWLTGRVAGGVPGIFPESYAEARHGNGAHTFDCSKTNCCKDTPQLCKDSDFNNNTTCENGSENTLKIFNSEGTCTGKVCEQSECCLAPQLCEVAFSSDISCASATTCVPSPDWVPGETNEACGRPGADWKPGHKLRIRDKILTQKNEIGVCAGLTCTASECCLPPDCTGTKVSDCSDRPHSTDDPCDNYYSTKGIPIQCGWSPRPAPPVGHSGRGLATGYPALMCAPNYMEGDQDFPGHRCTPTDEQMCATPQDVGISDTCSNIEQPSSHTLFATSRNTANYKIKTCDSAVTMQTAGCNWGWHQGYDCGFSGMATSENSCPLTSDEYDLCMERLQHRDGLYFRQSCGVPPQKAPGACWTNHGWGTGQARPGAPGNRHKGHLWPAHGGVLPARH